MDYNYFRIYRKLFKNLPLRLVLIIPFLIEVTGAVSIVGYLSFSSGQQAIRNLASKLQQEEGERTRLQVLNFIDRYSNNLDVVAEAMKNGLIDPHNQATSEKYLWGLVNQRLFLGIVWGSISGDSILVERTNDNKILAHIAQREVPKGQRLLHGEVKIYRKVYALDQHGNHVKFLKKLLYDARTRPWYTAAVAAKKPVWDDYHIDIANAPAIATNYCYPLYSSNNHLMGVLNSRVDINQIYTFLQQFKVSKTGLIFIVEHSGNMVASSVIKQPFIIKGEKIKRIKAVDIKEPVIQVTAQNLQKRFGSFKAITSSQFFDFIANGKRYFVQVTPIRGGRGIDWLSIVVVPESDFMEHIYTNTRNTIISCLATLAIAILLGWLTSRWISQPLLILSRTAEAIASGNLEQKVPHSFIKELKVLSSSFNYMSQELKTSYQNLEVKIEEVTRKLLETQAQLVQSEKMSSLARLVAGIAHEVNNPASFIQGNLSPLSEYSQSLIELLDLYKQHCPEEIPEIKTKSEEIDLEFLIQDIPKLISSIKSGSERIRDIVKSLRSFSRLDEAELKEVDIHEGIETSLMIIQNRLKNTSKLKEIEVIRDYASLPLIECYAGELNQVFMNILLNAVDALETCDRLENKIIRISTILYNSERVKISIIDNGTGMTEQVKNRLFDPFFTTKPVGKGIGMGMSISHQIVTQRHHGSLICFSEVGKGTEVLIDIPTKQFTLSV